MALQSLDIQRRSATSNAVARQCAARRSRSRSSSTSPVHRLQGLPGRRAWSGTTCATRSARSTAPTRTRTDLTDQLLDADALLRGEHPRAPCSGSSSRTAASTAPTRAASRRARRPARSCSTRTASSTSTRRTASAAATASPAARSTSRALQAGQEGLQVHALLRPRLGRPGAGVHQGLPDAGALVRDQGGHGRPRRTSASRTSKSAASTNAAVYDPAGVGGTHVVFVLPHGDPGAVPAAADPNISPLVCALAQRLRPTLGVFTMVVGRRRRASSTG